MPERFEALSLLALTAAQQGDFAGAIAGYDRVIAARPRYADAYSNRGASFAALSRPSDALADFDRAIAIDPDHAEAHFGRAIIWLLQGDFARGWPEFEWRWKTPQGRAMQERKGISQPAWLGGGDIAGKTMLLHSERGLGDTLQFCRFARFVRDRGATVLLQVQDALIEVLEPFDGVSRVYPDSRPPPPFDLHCPLLSLPLALELGLAAIPGDPYLRAPPSSVARWRAMLQESSTPSRARSPEPSTLWRSTLDGSSTPCIGLAWRGDPANPDDPRRSIALDRLLAHLPARCRYVSLQKELDESERSIIAAHPLIVAAHPLAFSLSQELNFAATAALCECLDLVISVDTSIAHLSAALGRKTWILLPFNADCRWLLDRSDSPWYPSVTLHRQTRSGDWAGVLARVAADLDREFARSA